MLAFFLRDEKIKHLGSGDYGLAKFITKDDGSSLSLRAALLGRLYGKFSLQDEQINDFELVFDTLETEKFRKEVALAAQRERAQQNAQAQAQAQVLGSSPSFMERLWSVYAKSESPYKQVPSSPAGSSAQGSARSTSTFGQVRPCFPKWQPGEVLSPVQRMCRMYTRIREDDAPAEVERPRPRLRSQVSSAAAAAGRTVDAGSMNIRPVSSNPIATKPAHQSVATPGPGPSAQHAARTVAAPSPAAAAAAAPKKRAQLVHTAATPAAPTAPATTPVSKLPVSSAVPGVSISPSVRTAPPWFRFRV